MPRIQSCHLPPITSSLLPWRQTVCSQCLSRLQQRSLSTTSPQYAGRNRQREKMYRWLNGPGRAFKEPLPGSTNYLNAYDMSGNLVRAKNMPTPGQDEDQSPESQDAHKQPEEDSSTNKEKEVSPQRQKSAKLLQEQAAAKAKDFSLPKETPDDLLPFPMNRAYRSQPVLSEELRDEIYKRVMDEGRSVRDVSAALGVEMGRVGAVVRLKALEKRMEESGEKMAVPFANAVMAMLPQTPYIPHDPIPHESINDLPVHQATRRQLFHPVSESRHFTRRDAAKVFDETLLPAEERIPHSELYEMEKWKAQGVVMAERIQRRREANEQEAKRKEELRRIREEKEQQTTKKTTTSRWEFRFQDISSEVVGADGRDRRGIGSRYGIPAQDRKKGQIKIPRRVET